MKLDLCLAPALKYWQPLKMPKDGDWLDSYNHGCIGFDDFKGKKITATKNVLYIQPITYLKDSKITVKVMSQLKQWLEAFYLPCKCVILPFLHEDTLDAIPAKDLGT